MIKKNKNKINEILDWQDCIEDSDDKLYNSERNFLNKHALETKNARSFKNVCDVNKVLNYLPRRILLEGVVLKLVVKVGEFISIKWRIAEELDSKDSRLLPRVAVLNPDEPWEFKRQYSALIFFHISKMLLQLEAIEINEDGTLNGNEKIVNSFIELSKYKIDEIEDCEYRLNSMQ